MGIKVNGVAVAGVGKIGPKGNKGDQGEAATIRIGTVTTGNPGTDAIVTNSGTETDAVLNFTIPRGEQGSVQGGLPSGGSTGQVLTKNSNTSLDASWQDPVATVFVAQATAPTNTKLLWIDTNTTKGGLKYYNGSAWVHVPVAYS